MAIAVCNGAMCQCSFGMAPCTLIVTSVYKIFSANMPLATIMDYQMPNLPSFGMCSSLANPAVAAATAAALGVLTPQPCSPVITSAWMPGSTKTIFAGKPALTNTSKNICAYGGMIQITNPGQSKLQIP